MSKKFKENRKIARHNIELKVSISMNKKIIAKNSVFKNLSISGCLIFISNSYLFNLGDKVIIEFEDEVLVNDLVFEPIEAIVKHCTTDQDIVTAGFEFINVSPKNKIIIQSIIDNKFLLKKFPKSWQITR